MTLEEALSGVVQGTRLPEEDRARLVTGLAYDSRKVQPGYLFFAFPGQHSDGRRFARQALERGALAVLSESAPPPGFEGPWLQVEHGRRALARAAANFHGQPDARLGITGITGTNGKTTTGFLLDSILRAAGKTTLLVGTVHYRLAAEILPAVNTTPESLDLFALFSSLERRGGTHVTMEVSSHALSLGRVWGIRFHTAVFTNLTRDHLDFHGTMEEYFAAKRSLFQGQGAPPPPFAVLNADDPAVRRIAVPPGVRRIGYGRDENADVRPTRVSSSMAGLRFDLRWQGKRISIESPLAGAINVSNILAASAAAISYGIDGETIARGVSACKAVPGRFERVDEGQPFLVVVDYAHTDDALRNTISVARELSPKRVITLFGCGGDRDRSKRPLMGLAAAEGSDLVVLTSDNPRSEDPLDIMNDALVGIRRSDTTHIIEPDRARAIRLAIEQAQPGDIVILAGKGHETYQVLKDRTIAFDDREAAREVLRSFGYGPTGP